MEANPIMLPALAVIVVAYAAILAASRRSPRELAWTLLPALLLILLLVASARSVSR